jgi:hypothetical protein
MSSRAKVTTTTASDAEIEKLCEEIFPIWLKNNVSSFM